VERREGGSARPTVLPFPDSCIEPFYRIQIVFQFIDVLFHDCKAFFGFLDLGECIEESIAERFQDCDRSRNVFCLGSFIVFLCHCH
jgi:hypothetical protein